MPIQTAVDSINNSVGSPYGFKNRIINGAIVIDQRQAGSNVAASVVSNGGYHTADRWAASTTQSSKFTLQQVTDAPAGFKNSVKLTSVSAYSAISSDYFGVMQLIEGYNVADLDYGLGTAKPTSLSFWAKSSITGTFGGSIYNGTNNRSYIFSYTVSTANTWQYVTVENIIGDTIYGTNTTNGTGLYVYFSFGVGANYVSTYSRSWITATGLGVTGQTNHVATNGATLQITGVQFEVGKQATAFDYRDFGSELVLCQRYFTKSQSWAGAVGSTEGQGLIAWYAVTTVVAAGWASHKVSMRTQPTITIYRQDGTINATNRFTDGAAVTGTTTCPEPGIEGFRYVSNASGGFTAGTYYQFYYTASAEL